MSNYNHPLVHRAIDVFQDPRIFVRIQAEIVATHARIFCSRVFAISLPPKDIVLNASDILYIDSRLDEVLRSRLSFFENLKRALLFAFG